MVFILMLLFFILVVFFLFKNINTSHSMIDEARSKMPYQKRARFLPEEEQALFKALKEAVRPFHFEVAPRVRLSDVVDLPRGAENWLTFWQKINNKFVDFLIFDPVQAEPVAVVGTAAAPEAKGERAERNKVLEEVLTHVGIPFLFLPPNNSIQITEITDFLQKQRPAELNPSNS